MTDDTQIDDARHLRRGRYRLLRELGGGGQARTLLARDRVTGRHVLLKHAAVDAEDLASEYRALLGLDHPNVVAVHDLYLEPTLGGMVLVEDHVAGDSLADRLGTIEAVEWQRIADDLVAALAHLQAAGLRHGDIKPANVMLRGRGRTIEALLVDFGYARPLTADELPGGTPAYFAPELAGGRSSTAADHWALGLTLAQARAGGRLPPAATELESMRAADPRLAALLLVEPAARRRALTGLLGAGARERLPLRLPFVGREGEARELRRRIIQGLEGDGPALVELVAAPGRGGSRLIEEQIERLRSGGAKVGFRRDWFDLELLVRELAVELGEDFDLRLPATEGPEALAAALWALADRRDRRVVVGLGRDAADLPAARALAVLAARQEGPARLVLVRPVAANGSEEGLPPLGRAEVEELCRRLLPIAAAAEPGQVRRLAELLGECSGGHPAGLEELLSRALATAVLDLSGGTIRFDEAAIRRLEPSGEATVTDPEAAGVAAALAANLGRLDRVALADLVDLAPDRLERAITRLRLAGLVRDPGGEDRPLAYLGPEAPGPAWPVSAPGADPEKLRARIAPWLESPWPDAVVRHAGRVLAQDPSLAAVSLRFLRIRALAAAGERRAATAALADLGPDERAALAPAELPLFESTLLGGLGRRVEAEAAVERGLAAEFDPDRRARLLAESAFLRLLDGDSRAALERAEEALGLARAPAIRARAATMAATAARQLGDLDRALERFALAESIFVDVGDRRREAALVANRALADLDAGRPGRAARALEAARSALAELGSLDQLAATAMNLGVARQALRDFVGAVRVLEEAERGFRLLGDLRRAAAARAARGIAFVDGAAPLVGSRFLAEAESELIGKHETDEPNPALQHRLRLERARADLLSGMPGRARRRLETVDPELLDPPSRERHERFLELFRPAAPVAVGSTPAELARRLRSRDLIARGPALTELVLRHHRAGRHGRARRQLGRLFGLIETMEKDMGESRRGLHRAAISMPVLENLRRRLETDLQEGGGVLIGGLHDTMIAVNEALDLEQALAAIARGVLGLGRALRVYLVDWTGSEARILAQARRDLGPGAAAELSTLILRRVAATDEPVIVADAGSDDLFGFAGSVRALGLRSVACFPLLERAEGRVMLYVDTPLASGAFDAAHRQALETFATVARTALSLHDRALRGEATGRAARREVESVKLVLESKSLELDRLRAAAGFGRLVGSSPAMRRVVALIDKVAPTELSVLITGETGCGKELIAQSIHAASLRRDGPFVAISCANIDERLAESELFGHRRGAFTGATGNRDGLFVVAEGGTIFLDEIGELPAALQAKLLRVLETRELRPVGGTETRSVDVRVIAATNRDVRDANGFRQDLYFRLAQVEIAAPSLRDRREDVPLLIRHALLTKGRSATSFEKEAIDALIDFDWPGNVRQLLNVVERCLLLAGGERVLLSDLPEEIWCHRGRKPSTLEELEAEAIRAALRYTEGEKKAAAALLGISRTALYEKLKRLGPDFA